jgi:hypothetical protein
MGKFEAITKGAAGRNNGISEAQSADVNAEIDRASGGHIALRITRSAADAADNSRRKRYAIVRNFLAIARGVGIAR